MKIYMDGELSAQSNAVFTIGNANNSNLLVGDSPGFPGRVFNGKIDEIRIWNVARSQSQIQSTMNTVLSPEYYSTADSGLAGYWRLDEGTGQIAQDLSSFSNNATLGTTINPETNDPTWVSANILIVNVKDENNNNSSPNEFILSQNYPNPFNPTTTIEIQITDFRFVNLKVYDVLGNEVASLVNEKLAPGIYKIKFNATNLPSGVYFYQLKAEKFVQTRKMILLR